jgi:isoleucyl-tRNA synthetase
VVIDCPACDGGRAWRVEPVLDAWFDSGSMPAAQWHYPHEHGDVFARRYPADFICEAIDQTRGWFYSLLAVNTLVFGSTPYRNVVCLGLLLDQDGQKMSKSRGNVVDPWEVLDSRGADALRWNFVAAGSPWTPKRVSIEGIDETTNRFLLTLWNTLSFFVTYANLDGWEPGASVTAPSHVMDRWIRSRLHGTVAAVTDGLERFDALHAAQALDGLVDDVSNWYVRRSRPRFWKEADAAAHATLHEVLRTVAQLLAPFTPFVADALHQAVGQTDGSVHLTDWPEPDTGAIDAGLEQEMALARDVVSLGLSARRESKLKVRQPLPRALVLLPAGATLGPEVAAEVADALNVKRLEPVATLEGLLDYSVVPNFRRLGPKVGKLVPRVKELLAAADGAAVRRALEADGRYALDVDGTVVELDAEDVEVRASSHEELALAQEGATAVALDTTVDHPLRLEGLARELVRALNDQRKAAGLEIADRIRVQLRAVGELTEAVEAHRDWIAGEVLAVDLALTDAALPDELEVEGAPVGVGIERVERA